MRYVRAIVLCCAIAIAVAAASTASASASAPEFGRCIKFKPSEKPYKGNYTNSGCTTKSETKEGKFEWLPGVEANDFTGTGGVLNLEGVSPSNRIRCESSAIAGEYSGTKEVKNVSLTLTGCKLETVRVCSLEPEFGKPIKLTGLEGVIGLDEVTGTYNAGLDLFKPGRGTIAELYCGGVIIAIRGSVIGQMKTDKMLSKPLLKYVGGRGFQTPSHLEGEPIDELEARDADIEEPFSVWGLTTQFTLLNEEQVEINDSV
jgi:hypothetical protein